jgi:hypothetical protein
MLFQFSPCVLDIVKIDQLKNAAAGPPVHIAFGDDRVLSAFVSLFLPRSSAKPDGWMKSIALLRALIRAEQSLCSWAALRPSSPVCRIYGGEIRYDDS